MAASGEFAFALQRVIFYTHNTAVVLEPQPLTVSAPRPHTKQCVHQEIYTADRFFDSREKIHSGSGSGH